jgi:hypothetical protein
MKLRSIMLAAAVVAAVGTIAPSAMAGTQAVTGTTLGNSISVGTISAATFGTSLGASGSTTSTLGTVPIVAIGPWAMTATGGGTAGDEGKMALVAGQPSCASSSAVLANPLQTWATALLGNFNAGGVTSSAPATLGSSAAALASGSGSNTVTVNYKWTPNTSDQLVAGCAYSQTTTLTIS